MPRKVVDKGKAKALYWTKKEQGIVDEVRELLIELDRLRYGNSYVKAELDKHNKGKYSDSKIVEYILEQGGRYVLKVLSAEIEKLKAKKKPKKKEPPRDPLEAIVKHLGKDSEWLWQQEYY